MQVGQRVVCVDDQFPAWAIRLFKELPVKGRTYTVRAVSLGRSELAKLGQDGKLIKNWGTDNHPTVRVLLEELHNPPDPCGPTNNQGGTEMGFNAERFRELEDTSTEEHLEEAEPKRHVVPLPVLTGEPIRGRTKHLCMLDDANWPQPITAAEERALIEQCTEWRSQFDDWLRIYGRP